MNKTEKSNFRQVFGVPVVLAIVSIVGLMSALLADGWGDVLSWLGLGIPVAVVLCYSLIRESV